jgi:hypothetical protein
LSAAWLGVLAMVSLTQLVTVIIAILLVSGALRSIGFTAYKPALPSLMSRSRGAAPRRHPPCRCSRARCRCRHRIAAVISGALASLAAATNHVAGAAYSWSYLILGFMMLVTAIETLRLPPDAGAAVTRSCPAPRSQE